MLRRALVHFRLVLGGIGAGVSILVVAEMTLRLLDVGNPRVFESARSADGTRTVRLAWNAQFDKAVPPAPQREFPADKPPAAYRIFVIGESAAEGVPYGTGFAFSAWLARRLEAQAPDVQWEVVNAALAGAQSWSALMIVRDIARWSPDLLVVYLGHNEVGTRFTAAEQRWLDPRRLSIATQLKETRLYTAMSHVLPMLSGNRQIDLRSVHRPGEAFAVIGPGGGRVYATMADRALSSDLYRARLEEMVRIMRSAGARTMLLTLSQNFSDWAPAASSHRPGMRADEKVAWRKAVREGDALASRDCTGALTAWSRALAIDQGFAELHFKLARCEDALGRLDEARAQFRLASDLDRLPQGASTSFNDILRDVARREGAILVDIDAVLGAASGPRLVGDDLFVDHCHPNIRANQLIAEAVADTIRVQQLAGPTVRWRPDAWVDPPAEAVLAADPELRTRELISRGLSCQAAARTACAVQALETAARLTRDAATREMLERAVRTADPTKEAVPREGG